MYWSSPLIYHLVWQSTSWRGICVYLKNNSSGCVRRIVQPYRGRLISRSWGASDYFYFNYLDKVLLSGGYDEGLFFFSSCSWKLQLQNPISRRTWQLIEAVRWNSHAPPLQSYDEGLCSLWRTVVISIILFKLYFYFWVQLIFAFQLFSTLSYIWNKLLKLMFTVFKAISYRIRIRSRLVEENSLWFFGHATPVQQW